jgi:hypothetical protein
MTARLAEQAASVVEATSEASQSRSTTAAQGSATAGHASDEAVADAGQLSQTRKSRVDCPVWWCARPAGHDGDAEQTHGRAIGEVETADATVGVSLEQLGDKAPRVVVWLAPQDAPLHAMTLDPNSATRMARSIDQTEPGPADRDGAPVGVVVLLVVDSDRSQVLRLDPTAAVRVARRIDRAVSLLTEQDGWYLGRLGPGMWTA